MGRRTIVLVIAVILAAVSGFAIWRYLSTVEEDVRANVTEVRVYRATQPIPSGTPGNEARPFIEESTALRENVVFPGSSILCLGPDERNLDLDPRKVGCPDNPSDLGSLLDGRVAAGPIGAGQLLTTEMFVTPAELNSVTLSESIPQGKVAVSIRPDEVGAVGGFIRPGDHVNLLASATVQVNSFLELLKDPNLRAAVLGSGFATPPTTVPSTGTTTGETTGAPGGEPVDVVAGFAETLPASLDFTQTVLQDLEVLAVGPDTRPSPLGTGLEPQGTQVVVLEVTPEQAEKIEFARQYANVSLSLLPADIPYTPFDSRGVVVDDLFTLLDRIAEKVEAAAGGSGN
jgi:Flp pilus assembly protein CpaB